MNFPISTPDGTYTVCVLRGGGGGGGGVHVYVCVCVCVCVREREREREREMIIQLTKSVSNSPTECDYIGEDYYYSPDSILMKGY